MAVRTPDAQLYIERVQQEVTRRYGLRKFAPPTPLFGEIVHKTDPYELHLVEIIEVIAIAIVAVIDRTTCCE